MNDIKSFTIYNEMFRLIDTMQPREKRDEFLGKLMDFYFKDKKPNFNPNSYEEIVWLNLSKPIISYKSKVINGSKGGRPKKTETKTENESKKESKSESESETTSDVYVYVNNNVLESNKGVIGGKEKTFKKPTVEEIKDYCLKRKNKINAEQFYDFYESKGWKVGNQKMKDWKACVRTWEAREKKDKPKEEKLPEWFGKENIEKKLNENEEKELKELIKSYE